VVPDLLNLMQMWIMTQLQELQLMEFLVRKEQVKKIHSQITLDYLPPYHFLWMVDYKQDVKQQQILGLPDNRQKLIKQDWTLNL
jgi:hypothetical protein